MAGNDAIRFLRGTASQRASKSEVLLAGQPFYETDTNKLYVGNGGPLKNCPPLFNNEFNAINNNISGLGGRISTIEGWKGQANGTATLDGSGKIPLGQMANLHNLTITVSSSNGQSSSGATYNGQTDQRATIHPFDWFVAKNVPATAISTGLSLTLSQPPWGWSASFFLADFQGNVSSTVTHHTFFGPFSYGRDGDNNTSFYDSVSSAVFYFNQEGSYMYMNFRSVTYSGYSLQRLYLIR